MHRLPLSVEDIASFVAMARSEAGISKQAHMTTEFSKLAENVHPIARGYALAP